MATYTAHFPDGTTRRITRDSHYRTWEMPVVKDGKIVSHVITGTLADMKDHVRQQGGTVQTVKAERRPKPYAGLRIVNTATGLRVIW